MTRWTIHVQNLERVPKERLLRDLAEDVAEDAKRLAPVRTGRLRDSIHVEDVTNDSAIVVADPRNPNTDAEDAPYAGFVERGTSDTPAQPFLRPATYRYRS